MTSTPLTYRLYKAYHQQQLTFVYQGEFSDDVTEDILRLNEIRLSREQGANRVRKKVNFLISECFQNVVRHADKPAIVNQTNNKPSHFTLVHDEQGYHVGSANLMNNLEVDRLEEHIKNLNEMDLEQLRSLYLEVLANSEFSDKGGAGLGLIEMARKTKEAYEYHFDFINFYHTLFYILVHLKPEGLETDTPRFDLQKVINEYQLFRDDDIQVLLQGDFSQATMLPLLDMIENSFASGKQVKVRKRLFHVLIEVLQNISRHGLMIDDDHPGIFLVRRVGNGFEIEAGNFVSKSDADYLQNQWQHLQGQDEEALNQLYRTQLKSQGPEKAGSAGLGLIDMARLSKGRFKAQFLPDPLGQDSDRIFYTINLQV